MLPEMKKDCDRFEEGHKKGNQSNVDLHKAMNTHITNLKLLAGPLEDIKNHLPSLEKDRGVYIDNYNVCKFKIYL
jgi:tyrosine-protein phosphatase non-receptor type 23